MENRGVNRYRSEGGSKNVGERLERGRRRRRCSLAILFRPGTRSSRTSLPALNGLRRGADVARDADINSLECIRAGR